MTIQVLVCKADGTQHLEQREVGEDYFPEQEQEQESNSSEE